MPRSSSEELKNYIIELVSKLDEEDQWDLIDKIAHNTLEKKSFGDTTFIQNESNANL